jgi:hypothetical protein
LYVKDKTPGFKTGLDLFVQAELIKTAWEELDDKSEWEEKHAGLFEESKIANERNEKQGESASLQVEI